MIHPATDFFLDIGSAVVSPQTKGSRRNAMGTPDMINLNQMFHCNLQGHFKFNPRVFKQDMDPNNLINYLNAELLRTEPEIVSFDLFSPEDSCNISVKGGFRYRRYNFVLQCLFFTLFALVCLGMIMVSGAKLAMAIVRDHNKAKDYSLITLTIVCVADGAFAFFFIKAGARFPNMLSSWDIQIKKYIYRDIWWYQRHHVNTY